VRSPSGIRGGAPAAVGFSACFRPQNASGSKKNRKNCRFHSEKVVVTCDHGHVQSCAYDGRPAMGWLAYVMAYEGLTGVDGDVEVVGSSRQESLLSSYAVSVPQLQAAECRRVVLHAYLVDEHVCRSGHPRQVPDSHVADATNPLAAAHRFLASQKRPMFGSHERRLRIRIACVR